MDPSRWREIKKIAIKAMFSDDYLFETLVLKGGNALDLVYDISDRASKDLDFSTEAGIDLGTDSGVLARIEATLVNTYAEHGYDVLDIKTRRRPRIHGEGQDRRWIGYQVTFKIIESTRATSMGPAEKQRDSTVLGPNQQRTLTIDISAYEYCKPGQGHLLDDLRVRVYSLEMIVIEKIRAICQQCPSYIGTVGRKRSKERARDFFDIMKILENTSIDLTADENVELARLIFDAKKVPLGTIREVADQREHHRLGYRGLLDDLRPGVAIESFDYYFDYVVDLCRRLESSWIV